MVVRDSIGRVIAALSEKIPLPCSAATVEVLACRRALIFAKDLSIFDTVVEGGIEVIIKVILTEDVSHPEFALVISNVLVLAAGFRFCSFSHVKRIGSSVAHFLARCSKSSNELQVWIESISNDLAPLVTRNSA